MNRKNLFALLTALAVLLAAAACSPTVTVRNNTQIPVRAVVRSGGTVQTVSPSPNGESSLAEVQNGPYQVTVIPDAAWIEYARGVRAYLNQQIANSDNLTGPQLLEVIRRLKEIAARMQQFEQAAGKEGSCGGTLTDENSSAVATVSVGISGALVITCK